MGEKAGSSGCCDGLQIGLCDWHTSIVPVQAGEAPSGSQDSLAAVVVEKDGRGAGKGSGGRKREGVEGERAVGGDESSPKRKDKKEKKEKRAKGGKRERGKEAKAEEGSGGAGDGEGRKKNKKRREK